MKKFLLLIREDLQRLQTIPEDEMQACIAEMTKWTEGLAQKGHFLAGEPLETEGLYVKKDHISTDGPFAEAREGISGFLLIQAKDLQQAGELAAQCPEVLNNTVIIEVRPVLDC
ncbi:YciI family protein [Chitinophaga cymbidii]|uniref:YCII-related domain-containing protein n=1 Tax=Chitinophaga cymbidii TaxID=1096750 RepID=A0A512RNQ5_9BACT|nr:YciI family protein [Chitinophaga cymbidii]GEP97322.1 hypothetical protein CCY01nite_35820 [Chitinophaga cymbidii]